MSIPDKARPAGLQTSAESLNDNALTPLSSGPLQPAQSGKRHNRSFSPDVLSWVVVPGSHTYIHSFFTLFADCYLDDSQHFFPGPKVFITLGVTSTSYFHLTTSRVQVGVTISLHKRPRNLCRRMWMVTGLLTSVLPLVACWLVFIT